MSGSHDGMTAQIANPRFARLDLAFWIESVIIDGNEGGEHGER